MPLLYWLFWLGGFWLVWQRTLGNRRWALIVIWLWKGPEVSRYAMALVQIVTGS